MTARIVGIIFDDFPPSLPSPPPLSSSPPPLIPPRSFDVIIECDRTDHHCFPPPTIPLSLFSP